MKKFIITSAVFLTLIVPSFFVYAQTGSIPPVALTNPLVYTSLSAIVTALLNIIIEIAEVACTLWIIWGGFLFVKARGNSEELSKAKSGLWHAFIGTAIILGANVILTVITNTINSIKAS